MTIAVASVLFASIAPVCETIRVGDHASKKMKPSALQDSGHAGVHGAATSHHDQQQRPQATAAAVNSSSPSRRSPKSPPRSPSWMRHHRDSPPRTISPSISPTERFPAESTLVDRPPRQPLDKRQVTVQINPPN